VIGCENPVSLGGSYWKGRKFSAWNAPLADGGPNAAVELEIASHMRVENIDLCWVLKMAPACLPLAYRQTK
jgi:hypothetical protein